jgi:adenylate cyclase
MLKRILQGIGIGCLAATLALLLGRLGWLEQWEGRSWDLRARLLAKPVPSTDRIRLIFLDQYCLDQGKERGWSWPWPRQVYGPILDFCRRGGARSVAFDVIFSEPSAIGVDDDAAFGTAISAHRAFVGAVFVGQERGGVTQWPADMPQPPLRLDSSPGSTASFASPEASFPVPEVATNAAVLATVFGNPDKDGIYRRLRPFSVFDSQPIPSLGLGACLAASSNRTIKLGRTFFQLGGNPTVFPLDAAGRVVLRYRGASKTHQAVNAIAVIDSEMQMREGKPPLIDPAFFKDTYVFFGFTAPGLFDLKSSPVDAVYPGVEVHATFLDNLLAGDFMCDAPTRLVVLLTFLLGVAAAVAVRAGGAFWHTVAGFLVFVPLPALLGLAAYAQGYWLPVVVLLAAVLPALVMALAVNYAMEGRQKRFIKGAFKQYLSPLVIEELVRHPERLKLGGETRELSLFFSDVQGFTGIAERLKPQQLTALLNEYLTEMTEIVYRHGGTVDKYEGDAVIAFWNAPLPQADHARQAVLAALECQVRLKELRPSFNARFNVELRQRIGINTGPVVVGNMGSRQRFNYTFLGDAGNLAARLEGLNKQFGTAILFSESTRLQLGDSIAVREISRVRVVGRQEPVRVFEPLSLALAPCASEMETFGRALAAYYAGRFGEAAELFGGLAKTDTPAEIYARRCRELADHPPAEWSGVWIVTEK